MVHKFINKSLFWIKFLRFFLHHHGIYQRGFTLVEVIVVVAIFGMLTSAFFANFLTAKSRSQAAAKVGELIGIAHECSIDMSSQLQSSITYAGITYSCGNSSPVMLSATFPSGANGVACLSDITGEADTRVAVTIVTSGAISCAFN